MSKNKLETWELQELGAMVAEIYERGFSVEIFGNEKSCHTMFRLQRHFATIQEQAPTLSESLGQMIDRLREEAGEPTRAEELASLVESDNRHAEAFPVELGEHACCGCGSDAPLVVERKIKYRISWRNGRILPNGASTGGEFPRTGEIGTCPKCGRNYTFQPS